MNRNTMAIGLMILTALGCQSLSTDPINAAVKHARNPSGMSANAIGKACPLHQDCKAQPNEM